MLVQPVLSACSMPGTALDTGDTGMKNTQPLSPPGDTGQSSAVGCVFSLVYPVASPTEHKDRAPGGRTVELVGTRRSNLASRRRGPLAQSQPGPLGLLSALPEKSVRPRLKWPLLPACLKHPSGPDPPALLTPPCFLLRILFLCVSTHHRTPILFPRVARCLARAGIG